MQSIKRLHFKIENGYLELYCLLLFFFNKCSYDDHKSLLSKAFTFERYSVYSYLYQLVIW